MKRVAVKKPKQVINPQKFHIISNAQHCAKQQFTYATSCIFGLLFINKMSYTDMRNRGLGNITYPLNLLN